jgi:hypothetical protein
MQVVSTSEKSDMEVSVKQFKVYPELGEDAIPVVGYNFVLTTEYIFHAAARALGTLFRDVASLGSKDTVQVYILKMGLICFKLRCIT